MKSIAVKQCCVSPSGVPRFNARIGDELLVHAVDGSIQQVTIQDISDRSITCKGLNSEDVTIDAEQVICIYTP